MELYDQAKAQAEFVAVIVLDVLSGAWQLACKMVRFSLAAAHSCCSPRSNRAFPSPFQTKTIAANGTQIHVRVGGSGPAVILIHGFGDTGDMWVKLAKDLVRDHTVVVPDLRGTGLSAKPSDGHDKWTQAGDMRAVLEALGIDNAAVVGHDIGSMVAALYAQPGAMHAAFAQFRSLRRDAEDNKKAIETKLSIPVLAVGGEKSFGARWRPS